MHYNSNRNELELSSQKVFKKIIEGEIKPHISKIFDLKDATKAHLELQSRLTSGSIIFKT